MPRFSANISMMFREVDLPDRFDAAARAGFKAVEIQFPYEFDKEMLAERARRAGVEVVLINLTAGDFSQGDRGIGCLPGREAELREGVATTIDYALALNCKRINLLGGIPPKGTDLKLVRQTFVSNLKYAAAELKKHDIRLVIEPVNTYNSPGVFLTRTDQAADIIRDVGADNLGIEYDVYQAQLMEGDLTNTIRKYLPQIWHMQVADVPSRAEPGTGEINYDHVLGVIEAAGYQGWIGCDYEPSTATTNQSFGWMKKWDPSIG